MTGHREPGGRPPEPRPHNADLERIRVVRPGRGRAAGSGDPSAADVRRQGGPARQQPPGVAGGPEQPYRSGPPLGPSGPSEYGPSEHGPSEHGPSATGGRAGGRPAGNGQSTGNGALPGSGRPEPAAGRPYRAAGWPGQQPRPQPGGPARPAHPSAAAPLRGVSGAGPCGDPDDAEGQQLRALLHRTVGGLEPAPGALDELRAAVPRRRTRRRRVLGSSLALLAVLAVGVPVIRAATSASVEVAAAPGGMQQVGSGGPGLPAGAERGDHMAGPVPVGSPTASLLPGGSGVIRAWGYPGAGATTAPGSSATGPLSALPQCTRAQLGAGRAELGRPGSDGTVYGAFWVANISSTACVVSSPGTVAVTAAQGTEASQIHVQMHTSADPATGLPNPQSAPPGVALAPSSEYQVDFAWVPDSGNAACATQASVQASPAGTADPPADGGASGPASGGSAGPATAGSAAAPPTASGSAGGPASSITLGHTPGSGGAGGSPAATVRIPGACSGTVYRTEPLPVSGGSGSGSGPGSGGSGPAAGSTGG